VSTLQIRLLGALEARVDGRTVDLGGPRQRAVLALLLVGRGAPVSVDRLIEDLWRGEAPQRASASLQAYVSNLRRVLEPDRAPRTPAGVLVSAPPGYAMRLAGEAVDAWRFEALVRRAGEAGGAEDEIAVLDEALGLWRGAALAEFAGEEWAGPEAARLEELRWVARERLVDARVRAGRAGEAVVEAEALVRDAPLREEGWRLLALAQYASGRQADALATLREARRLLSEELGIDPGPRLAALERDVLTQEVELAAPARRGRPSTPAVAPPPQPEPEPGREFVGRTVERGALRDAAAATRAGVPSVALLAGEAGGGKSALLAQLRAELAGTGWRVAVGRCPEDDGGLPARAWLEALRDLAAAAVDNPPPELLAAFLSDDWRAELPANLLVERFRLHRAIGEWLSTLEDRPLAVLLDDVHRADGETRALLAGLLDQGLAPRMLFVLAYRPEPGEALDDLLATIAHHAPTRVRLAGLAPEEAAQLIAEVTGAPPEPGVVRALAERTDGNPFYLTESARLLASEGTLVATSQVPQGVADVLRRRLARLPAETVSVLRLASVIGRDVDITLLVAAAELDEDAVYDALEAGVIAGLLTEPAPGAVRFSHLLVRETLYAGVPDLRRRRWHARVAEAVATLYPGDLTALAHHAARAATGESARSAAARCVAAAELSEARFTFDSAADFYAEATRCLALLPEPDRPAAVEVMIRHVPALIRAGGTIRAAQVRREAALLAAGTADTTLLARAVNCGTIPAMHRDLRAYGAYDAEFVALIERVLADPTVPDDQRALALATYVTETARTGNPRTEPAYLEACEIAERIGNPIVLGLAHWAGAELYHADLRPERRRAILEALRRVGDEHDLPVFQVVAYSSAVSSDLVELDLPRAHADLERAAELSRRFQLRQGMFICNVVRAMVTHATGDPDRAEQLYEAEFEEQIALGSVDIAPGRLIALATLRYTQGRLAELVEDLRQTAADIPPFRNLLALALAESGALEEAREVLADAPPLEAQSIWQMLTTMRALTVAALGDRSRAPELYEQLLPFAGQIAGGGTNGFVLVPVARALGRLALLLDRPEDARRHFERARSVGETCGSAVWIEQAVADLAELALA